MPIQLRNLQKSYPSPEGPPVHVLNVAALDINEGEQLALVGTSGSGKSTLLHCIAGILLPDSGAVTYTLAGRTTNITTLKEAARDQFRAAHVGYVFQSHHLLPGFSALENVLLAMGFASHKPDPDRAKSLLNDVGLSHRLHYKPGQLSLGQQQRVAVARALANRPALVLADEPTGSLDPASADAVITLITSLCQKNAAALVLVTHDQAVASRAHRQVRLADINKPD